jgi:AAA family ATP:ADP antiporter
MNFGIRGVLGKLVPWVFGVRIDNPKVWQMQRLIFVLILTLLLIKPTANAIFLSKVGVESLPKAYLMVAVLALLFTLVYNRYVSSFSPIKIFYVSIQVCIGSLLTIGVILLIPGYGLTGAYAFYLFMSIFGVLSASQFWILANQLFDAREARKYFGISGFGAIAGGIIGGYLASFISSFLQSEIIPFVAVFFLLLVLFNLKRFSNPLLQSIKTPLSSTNPSSLKKTFELIYESKHLFYIALVITTSVFTSKLLDYQFGYFSSASFQNEEELTSFYGIMYSTFNLTAILIQVLLTTRVIGRLGIGFSLLILPLFLVVGSSLLFVLPGLILSSGIKLADASMKQSINKAAIELIMLPVPKDIKLKTKAFLDVFVDSIATGITGIILLLVIKAFSLPNWMITLLILFSSIIWLYLANKIRQEYKTIFRQSLNVKPRQSELLGNTIFETYQNILNKGTDFQKKKALSFLIENPIPSLEQSFLKLIDNENTEIVSLVIELLMYSKHDYSDKIKTLLNHSDSALRIQSIRYLINHQERFESNFLLQDIDSSDSEKKINTIIAFAQEFKNDPRTLNLLRVEKSLVNYIELYDNNPPPPQLAGVLLAIGYGKFTDLYDLIDKHMASDIPELRHQAIIAAGLTQSSQYLKKLLVLLESREDEAIVIALSKYSILRLTRSLETNIKNNNLNVLKGLAMVLELKPSQSAVELLNLLIKHRDLGLRNRAIKVLRELSDHYPLLFINKATIKELLIDECRYTNQVLNGLLLFNSSETEVLDLELNEKLISLLKQKIDHNLKVIFELLHIHYPPENYIELYAFLRTEDTELRNNAIEYVDNSLSYDLKSSVIPLLDYIGSSNNYNDAEFRTLKKKEIKSFLLQNRDVEIKETAMLYYKHST